MVIAIFQMRFSNSSQGRTLLKLKVLLASHDFEEIGVTHWKIFVFLSAKERKLLASSDQFFHHFSLLLFSQFQKNSNKNSKKNSKKNS